MNVASDIVSVCRSQSLNCSLITVATADILFRCKTQATLNEETSMVHPTPLDYLVEHGFLFGRYDVGLNHAKAYDGLSSRPDKCVGIR